jgi:hypothetical protein
LQPAQELLALHKSRFLQDCEAASPGSLADFSRPVFMAAALHLTATHSAAGKRVGGQGGHISYILPASAVFDRLLQVK